MQPCSLSKNPSAESVETISDINAWQWTIVIKQDKCVGFYAKIATADWGDFSIHPSDYEKPPNILSGQSVPTAK